MKVKLATSVTELERCFPVVVQLRPHLDCDRFIAQVQRQQQAGYQLAYIEADGQVRAIAGFRIIEQLFRGRLLYVDDLVTEQAVRSQGYGDFLIDWLVEYAKANDCQCIELDSGVQRGEAHRFYFRKRFIITAYRFRLNW
jgi:GNAT superfamily N-acetyltransferase